LAYHDARKRAAVAALAPSTSSAQVAAAEALFSDSNEVVANEAAEATVVETPAE
jgi:DNA-directed RNA polymerase subunit beta'